MFIEDSFQAPTHGCSSPLCWQVQHTRQQYRQLPPGGRHQDGGQGGAGQEHRQVRPLPAPPG